MDYQAIIATAVERAAYGQPDEDGMPSEQTQEDVTAILALLGEPEEAPDAVPYAFDPEEPRGQPDNAGQWVAGGGKPADAAPPADPVMDRAGELIAEGRARREKEAAKERLRADRKQARRDFLAGAAAAFGEGEPEGNYFAVKGSGRSISLEFLPRERAVFVDFTQGETANASAKQEGKSGWDYTARELQPGTVDFLHKFKAFITDMGQKGIGIHYETTEDRRARLYARVLQSASFTEASPGQWQPPAASVPGTAAVPYESEPELLEATPTAHLASVRARHGPAAARAVASAPLAYHARNPLPESAVLAYCRASAPPVPEAPAPISHSRAAVLDQFEEALAALKRGRTEALAAIEQQEAREREAAALYARQQQEAEEARIAEEARREEEAALYAAQKAEEGAAALAVAVRQATEDSDRQLRGLSAELRSGISGELLNELVKGLRGAIAEEVKKAVPSPVVAVTLEKDAASRTVRVVRRHRDGSTSVQNVARG